MSANEKEYMELYGNIDMTSDTITMAKCNCTKCNSCACGRCSKCISQCTGCKKGNKNVDNGSFDLEWEVA